MTEQTALVAFSEDSAKAALIEARGDIFVASQMLGVTALRLDRAVRVSPILQAVYLAIQEESQETAFQKISTERLEAAIQHRLSLYRVAGLDSLYELATMPIDENSAQNQVRLAAAARLAGSTGDSGAGGEIGETLRALNEAYQANAPRIRIVRERLSVEIGQSDRVIEPD